MTFLQLGYLMAVAEYGSINKAASRLFVSQSGMSAAIKELERELGIVIFRRTNRGVSFTDAGYRFFEQARPLVEQAQKLRRRYGHGSRHPHNSLRVSAQHYPFAVQAFVAYLGGLGADAYDLRLRESDLRRAIEDVASGESDLGIIFLSGAIEAFIRRELDERGLDFHPLGQCRPHAYMRRGHPLAGRDSLTVQDLKDYPYVCFDKEQAISSDFSEEVALDSFELPPRVIAVNDRRTLYSVVAGSDAVSIGTGLLTEGYSDPHITVRPIHSPGDWIQLGWIGLRGQALSPAAERYLNHVRAGLASLLETGG